MGRILSFYRKLPEPVRFTLNVGRVISGLRGAWWLWGVGITMVADGAIWTLLGSLPLGSRISIMAGIALMVFTGLGQIGAVLKGRSGHVRLMGDTVFRGHIKDLVDDTAAYMLAVGIMNAAAESPESAKDLMGSIPPRAWRDKGEIVTQAIIMLVEAKRRGFINSGELARFSSSSKLSGVLDGLQSVLGKMTLVTRVIERPVIKRSTTDT